MVDRPILKLPDPVPAARRTGPPGFQRKPKASRTTQGPRFQSTFNRMREALERHDTISLRVDPSGIAPERALVFVTTGIISNFTKAASRIGLEVIEEKELDEGYDLPEGVEFDTDIFSTTLYATIPTIDALDNILRLWDAYNRDEKPPDGSAPWWRLFESLLELRPWGPEDRFPESVREIIANRLPDDESESIALELEIWPSRNVDKRTAWRVDTEAAIIEKGGEILDRSEISDPGFTYAAILAKLSVTAVRTMLDDPSELGGLATLEGVQFILPQMLSQAVVNEYHEVPGTARDLDDFNSESPVRAALLDGTPIAAHSLLTGGVVIEDLHDLVRLSTVENRHHGTSMASLILRGDIEADGTALRDSRLVCAPLLIDDRNFATSPNDRLFVDLVHSTLVQLFQTDEPKAPDVFVINFSIGIQDVRFAGRVSSLARLIDWWSATHGVLFVISAGNITDDLELHGVTSLEFENAEPQERASFVRTAVRGALYARTLLAPAESLNGLTVGAISKDASLHTPPASALIVDLDADEVVNPQITSAVGLGPNRIIKPDLLNIGGRQEARLHPSANSTKLHPLTEQERTGLVVAAPGDAANSIRKTRGTSQAAALTTRAILQSADLLFGDGGPFGGQQLSRHHTALLTRALAVNSAMWPAEAVSLYQEERDRLGPYSHERAKEEVSRFFGHGYLNELLMQSSPEFGATLVGIGAVKKDQAQVFNLPLPDVLSGERVPRSMRATIAWFSPVDPVRATYRLAALEAIASEGIDYEIDKGWGLDVKTKSGSPTTNMSKRGTVWSRRLVHNRQTLPEFGDDPILPICVQCRDASNGGLDPDEDIAYAIVVTLEVEAEVQYDIHQEIDQRLRVMLRASG